MAVKRDGWSGVRSRGESVGARAHPYYSVGFAVPVPVDSSVSGDGTKTVAVQCHCCAGRILLGRVPVDPCDVARTCGCDTSVVDAGPGQSAVLGTLLAHEVDVVRRSRRHYSSTQLRATGRGRGGVGPA